MPKIGERVGVIFGGNDDGSVSIFGYGTYEGEKVPPPGVIFMGIEHCRVGLKNPCLRLDNGDEVFGAECWWGPEAGVRKSLEGKQTREVKIADVRRMNREQYTEEELAKNVEGWREGERTLRAHLRPARRL